MAYNPQVDPILKSFRSKYGSSNDILGRIMSGTLTNPLDDEEKKKKQAAAAAKKAGETMAATPTPDQKTPEKQSGLDAFISQNPDYAKAILARAAKSTVRDPGDPMSDANREANWVKHFGNNKAEQKAMENDNIAAMWTANHGTIKDENGKEITWRDVGMDNWKKQFLEKKNATTFIPDRPESETAPAPTQLVINPTTGRPALTPGGPANVVKSQYGTASARMTKPGEKAVGYMTDASGNKISEDEVIANRDAEFANQVAAYEKKGADQLKSNYPQLAQGLASEVTGKNTPLDEEELKKEQARLGGAPLKKDNWLKNAFRNVASSLPLR